MKSSRNKAQNKKKSSSRKLEPSTSSHRSDRSDRSSNSRSSGRVRRTSEGTIEENSEEAAP